MLWFLRFKQLNKDLKLLLIFLIINDCLPFKNKLLGSPLSFKPKQKQMKKLNIFIIFLVISIGATSIEPSLVLRPLFEPHTVQYSPDGRFLILESDHRYEVWSTESNERLLEGNYRFKIGRLIDSAVIREGSGFILVSDEDVFIAVDYTLTSTSARAFELSDGSLLWESEELSLGLGVADALTTIVSMGTAAAGGRALTNVAGAPVGYGMMGTTGMVAGAFSNDPVIDNAIHHIPELNAITFNSDDGLQLAAVRTGELLWQQEEVSGAMGEVFYDPENNLLIAISILTSEIQQLTSRPEILAIDAGSGELVWRAEYISNFRPGHAFVIGQALVTDYFGIALYDIKTGERIEGEVAESYSRAESNLRIMSRLTAGDGQGFETTTSVPQINENNHILYITGMRRGNSEPQGGAKALQKIDPESGDFVFFVEDIAGRAYEPIQTGLSDELLYVKMVRRTNTHIMGINPETGEVVFETEPVRNRLTTEYDYFTLMYDAIMDASSTGLQLYNRFTGELLKEVSFRDIGVGRLRNYSSHPGGFAIFGTDGVALVSASGEVQKELDMGNIQNFFADEDEIWLLDNRRFRRLDASSLEVLSELDYPRRDMIEFSPTGNSFVHLRRDGVAVYNIR